VAIFTSGRTWNYLGYKTVWRPVVYGATPDISDPAFPLDSTLDPRGEFPSGMLPSKAFSYRFYQSVSEQTTADSTTDILNAFEQLTGALGAPSLVFASVLPSVVFSRHTLYDAVTIFEGRDVIDLPTEGLRYEDNVLYVPSKVYRPLHAGEEKFIQEGESISRQSIISFSQPPADDLVVAMKLSDGAPADVKRLSQAGADRRLVDVLSNGIICRSKPNYVSYVAVDSIVMRDVVVLTGSSQAIGLASPGLGGFKITETSQSGPWQAKVYRFALVNVSEEEGEEKLAWRLSETFGVKPQEVVEAPPGLVSSSSREEQVRNAADADSLHYAYNLNDEGEDPTFFNFAVTKTAYSPLLAKASGRSTSRYYDESKAFKVIDYALDYAAGDGIAETLSIGLGRNESGLQVDALYTSPRWIENVTASARLGTEYMAYRPFNTSVIVPSFGPSMINTSIVLATTTTVATGMVAINDCCLYSATLFDMLSTQAGDMMIERGFDDIFWKKRSLRVPDSTLDKYLVGENPARSDGKPSLVPSQLDLEATITADKNVTMPSEKYATALMLRLSTSENAKIALFAETDGEGDALYEMDFGDTRNLQGQDSVILTNVPGLVFRSYTSEGVTIERIFGIGSRDPVLPEMTVPEKQPKDQLSDLRAASTIQLSYVKAESLPIESSNVTATTDCTEGRVYLAYENKGRIDMAVRYGCNCPLSVVRDVTLRVVSEEEQAEAARDASDATADSGTPFPDATLPFLVGDDATKTTFLFFLYKAKICCKRCPSEVFDDLLLPAPDEPSGWEDAKDGDAAQALHALGADMAYDGAQSDEGEDKANDASRDVFLGALRPLSEGSDSSGQPVVQYCAFLTKRGHLLLVIQSEEANLVRRSANGGKTWSDALPADFSFIPPIQEDVEVEEGVETQELEESQPAVAESPYGLYDDALDSVTIFFVFRNSLMYVKIAVEAFLKQSDDEQANDLLSEIKPKILFGRYTTEMFRRGITEADIEDVDRGASAPRIPAQRVAAVKTDEGFYRVFFKDDDQKLYSLVSKDAGESWWWPEAPSQEAEES